MKKNRLPPLLVLPAVAFTGAFLVYPLALVVMTSLYDFSALKGMLPDVQLGNYAKIFSDFYYLEIFASTVRIALIVTLSCLVIGYPLALWITRQEGVFKAIALFCALAPLMISVVIRSLGWMVILSDNGVINTVLINLGIVTSPVRFLYTEFAVFVGLTEALLPFMVMSLVASLQVIPRDILQAASVAGAGPWTIFWRVLFPLSLPGIAAGGLPVFAIAVSSFVTPRILGGGQTTMVSNLVVDNFLVTLNWPFGTAVGLILLVIILLVFTLQHFATERLLGRYR